MFVLVPRDSCPNTSAVQILAIFPECIPFIARYPLGTDAQVTITVPDCALLQKPFGHGDLMLLTGR